VPDLLPGFSRHCLQQRATDNDAWPLAVDTATNLLSPRYPLPFSRDDRMPRTRYQRKRPGHRAYIASLWQTLHRFMEPASWDQGEPDVSGLRSDGLSPEQIGTIRRMLTELGDLFRGGLGGGPLPANTPDFFAIGADMPAFHFSGSPKLRHHLKPKGRSRKAAASRIRPQQVVVDTWMLGRAAFAFDQGEPALKESSVVPECMVATNASRAQARVSFSRLPRELRRQRGQHDRWITYRAPKPA
jgi:hypothetical protein